jgi:hypothetical protein
MAEREKKSGGPAATTARQASVSEQRICKLIADALAEKAAASKLSEVSLKEPIKILIVPPLFSLDVTKIRGQVDTDSVSGAPVLTDGFLRIEPKVLFSPQHPTWLDTDKATVKFPPLWIAKGNIAGIIVVQ